jgi:hypothetical protein
MRILGVRIGVQTRSDSKASNKLVYQKLGSDKDIPEMFP